MRRHPVDRDPPDPYTYGLHALGRRELTARQLRDRLRRRGCDDAAIDAALDRLRREGALDDARAARAYARTEVAVKRRGPERIRRALHAMGVDEDAASNALASGFADHPAEDVLEAALARRLRGPVTDRAHEQRLIAYLVRQGFEVAAAAAAVRRHRQA
jgi:regulatory protein